MTQILFLFNHDAPHQVAHLGGIVRSMREMRPDLRIVCATSAAPLRDCLKQLMGEAASTGVEWLDIGLPAWLARLSAILNLFAPIHRLLTLDRHAARLLDTDLLVSAERTCLRLRRPGNRGAVPRFVHVPHGAGDRSVSFHPGKAGFDRILVSGEKTARALVAHGAAQADRLRIVGYSKFDVIAHVEKKPFENDAPIFLYNPHFDPFLSSWYDEGPALLDWFARGEGRRFNLIFAPHIMLFRRKLHVSLDYRRARVPPAIPPACRQAPNILVDIDGPGLIDMSHILAADAYIGDVSSQIYEFLLRPRPAFFLDTFSHDRRSREGRYPAWAAGDVVRSADALKRLLPAFRERAPLYRGRQEQLFADTISVDPRTPASRRAAEAILELVA